ncbi:MAG: 3-dehydroquinate synthase family protein [Acidimicrobiia bacterium]
MTTVRVELDPGYDVVVGAGVLDTVGTLVGDRRRVVVVSQAAVAERYAEGVRAGLTVPSDVVLMGDGEQAKTLATVDDLCRQFARGGLLRGDAVIALGGGVVGDTAGFAAAVYHRGVAVVQVPTTLLAMVDAAIGGKTAVNLPEGKNLVGAFHQPIGVVADTDTLTSISERDFHSGLGEVAKYALMYDVVEDPSGLVELLRTGTPQVVARDPEVLADVVARCVAIKADVVARDPLERTGLRATLNLGHTMAHALEIAFEHRLTHGEAVAIGLVFAGALAGGCERVRGDVVDRFQALPFTLGLPTVVPDPVAVSPAELLALMARDKKASGGLTFVLPGPDGLELVDDPPPAALRYAFESIGYSDEVLP